MAKMDKAGFYEIRVEGHLSQRWSEWFEELAVCSTAGGDTVLTGAISDQSALFGLLNKIHGLNLTLISVRRLAHLE